MSIYMVLISLKSVLSLLQIDRDREANVTDAAVKALAALAGCLPWTQYHQLLNQWLNTMRKTPTKVSCKLCILKIGLIAPPQIKKQSRAAVTQRFLS